MDTECIMNKPTAKLSKYPTYKSAPDVIAAFRQHNRSEITVRPVQLTSPHINVQRLTNDNRATTTPSPCSTHMEEMSGKHGDVQDDWHDVVDVHVEASTTTAPGLLTREMLQTSLTLLFPALDAEVVASIHALLLHPDHGFGTYDFDVLALRAFLPSSSLVLVSHAIFSVMSFDGVDMPVLLSWVGAVEAVYDPAIPYHNADHAADVVHSLFCALMHTPLRSILSVPMQIAGLLAAITHDAAHFGRTNLFLKKSHHALATTYPVCCPLEEMHAAVGLNLLSEHNVLAHLPKSTQTELRHVMHSAIFTTSLCEQKNLLASLRAVNTSSSNFDLVVLQAALHAADLGQTTKPFAVHRVWVDRLGEELFRQGDAEKVLGWPEPSAMCDRLAGFSVGGQLFFMQNLVLPVYTALNQRLDGGLEQVLRQIAANIDQWTQQLLASPS
ncbi:hypothetical protein DYB37_007749 [Aphanomyces astaci]|uniref:PDEase domain-containing protein n=1 Tax=Aphanomyces astaci TaxID=112090 RepID=A0A3R6XP77_APHAT|nr:hypothetical protein DYB35_004669 [Aphanomyces astaci]RHZ27628.1 hypothetical protein DYB37_007749 [Aphanomyces astaci]